MKKSADSPRSPQLPQSPRNAVPLFALGRVVATQRALDLLERAAISAHELLLRHQRGDWGSVDAEDAAANDAALVSGCRVLSSYVLINTERLWIITEWDRSATTLLLPDEY